MKFSFYYDKSNIPFNVTCFLFYSFRILSSLWSNTLLLFQQHSYINMRLLKMFNIFHSQFFPSVFVLKYLSCNLFIPNPYCYRTIKISWYKTNLNAYLIDFDQDYLKFLTLFYNTIIASWLTENRRPVSTWAPK